NLGTVAAPNPCTGNPPNTATITIVATVPTNQQGPATDTASVTTGDCLPDPNLANNTDTETTGQLILCSRSDQCFVFELLEVDFNTTPGSAIFTWRLQNNCQQPLARVDFRFVPGAAGMVTAPAEGTTYSAPAANSYDVDQVGGPHPGIGFVPQGTGFSGGS